MFAHAALLVQEADFRKGVFPIQGLNFTVYTLPKSSKPSAGKHSRCVCCILRVGELLFQISFEASEDVRIQGLQQPCHFRWYVQHPHVMLASMVHDISMDRTSSGIHDENDLVLCNVFPDAIV